MSEWAAYWRVEGLGGPEDRADLRMGIVASTIANANRNPDAKPEPFAPSDFLPRFDDESASSLSPEAFSAVMHARYGSAG